MSAGTLPPAGDWIRSITIKQPWTTAILTGAKTIENRPPALVLARVGPSPRRKEEAGSRCTARTAVARTIRGRELHLGAVIGVARLTGCHEDTGSELCSPWAQTGVHHLVLADAQELALPVPADGALGPWKPTPDLVAQVLQQLPDLRP